MDRRTNTSDGSGGASPTVVTAQHDDDDDLMADTDEDTQIMATSAVRAARQKVARAAAAAKEVLANGSSAPANVGTANGGLAGDEKDAVADQVPALPADSIGTARDSSSLSFSRSAAPPIPPVDDDEWTLGNDGLSSSIATPEAEPAPAEEEAPSISTGTGWPGDGTLFGAGVGTERSDPAPAASPASEPTVSAASFVWDAPDPEPTSPSSPARNFLRSSTTAKTSAPPRTPPVSVAPAKASPEGTPLGGTRPKASKRSARQAHLTVARVEPWSVMKFSFVVSLVAFVILFVAVSVIYGTLSALGVFTSLQHVVQSVTSSQDSGGVNAAKWFTASRILSYTALLGALNIVLITAMATIGAVVYNLTSRLIGGVEVTLRETE
ncbi:MAG TPA: DUF3566 domain-containing protein [Streptosporangiaceae bacterium]|nr:DUF3566 domain-containing protein [Streptosporangiaceae bacterium]